MSVYFAKEIKNNPCGCETCFRYDYDYEKKQFDWIIDNGFQYASTKITLSHVTDVAELMHSLCMKNNTVLTLQDIICNRLSKQKESAYSRLPKILREKVRCYKAQSKTEIDFTTIFLLHKHIGCFILLTDDYC